MYQDCLERKDIAQIQHRNNGRHRGIHRFVRSLPIAPSCSAQPYDCFSPKRTAAPHNATSAMCP
jgi:hypothetical protein